MSWSKKREPNVQEPDLKREHRASVELVFSERESNSAVAPR